MNISYIASVINNCVKLNRWDGYYWSQDLWPINLDCIKSTNEYAIYNLPGNIPEEYLPTGRYVICLVPNSETSNLDASKIYEWILHVAGSNVIAWPTRYIKKYVTYIKMF